MALETNASICVEYFKIQVQFLHVKQKFSNTLNLNY